jgi:NADP-dependent 3-hydroxy acid dehydrogenase YdfG
MSDFWWQVQQEQEQQEVELLQADIADKRASVSFVSDVSEHIPRFSAIIKTAGQSYDFRCSIHWITANF